MHACVIFSTLIVFSSSVTLRTEPSTSRTSKTKIELKPIRISCSLTDIVVISAPVIQNAIYYLYKPSGECTKLNVTRPKYYHKKLFFNDIYDNIVIQNRRNYEGIVPVSNFRVFNLNDDVEGTETFEDNTKKLNSNDFIIGPLLREDHGNWVLSAYYQDIDGDWVETFQVITIEITDYVPPSPTVAHLKQGDTFAFSFAYPIQNLTSCELIAPRSTFDRFYERSTIDMDTCGYVIRNLTSEDQGLWRITGVGDIVYGTQVYLEVLQPNQKSLFDIH
ncbi:uncharacterized protein LOC114350615 [Ostrinia furnacalis]|uniref:uncharacterized protein LOC114350615 n=1 Tax=Ostrinia furnacalis TaxID=93504 RepID=UPI00103B9119|nr:uncharacterized protein LOC114350615 [Ostrinia furnacalis]